MARLTRPHRDAPVLDAIQSIANLELYLRSDLGVNGSSGKVAQWNDQSGKGRHAAQATGALQPTYTSGLQNGMPGLVYGGTQTMKTPASTMAQGIAGWTAFAVALMNTAGTAGYLLGGQWGGQWLLAQGGGAGQKLQSGTTNASAASVFVTAPATNMATVGVFDAQYDGAHVTQWKNAVQCGQGAQTGVVASGSIACGVGASATGTQPMVGNLYALLFFSRALSGAEQTTVRNTLNAIYAIY